MALDNAQFISELSITDPPGTDPLSQGDDQIRTIKRATFQSFPNVAAQVSLTDVQLNAAAIKTEANVFTANQTIKERLFLQRNADTGFTQISYRNAAGVSNWDVYMAPLANGDNLTVDRNVGGLLQDTPWKIRNSDGVVEMLHVPEIGGAPLWIAGEIREFVAAVTPGANWFKADGTLGTVNLQGRWRVMESAFLTLGTSPNASLTSVTTATGITGSTALTEAQLAAHNHTVYMTNNPAGGITDAALNATDNVFGARRNDSSKQFSKSNGTRDVIGNAGSGSGHTHADGGNALVLGQPAFSDTVQPLSFVTTIYQYVP